MKCSICNKNINDNEGFMSNVDNDGKELRLNAMPIVVCSPICQIKFEETLPMKGKPIKHISRITGYYQVVENWNPGKQQEFFDRKRYHINE